jgi:imidazole glycerol-phosphate synthase subunit HisH
MRNKIGIIDTGISNLGSLASALHEIEADYDVISSFDSNIDSITHFILPGVGSFESGMSRLSESGMDDLIIQVIDAGAPVLGICLGMHLLCSVSEESDKKVEGLMVFDVPVDKLEKNEEGFWPKIGWSSVDHLADSLLLKGIPSGEDFYFIHGFGVGVNEATVSTSRFCHDYSAIISSGHTFGVQFHPEKSQKFGLKLLQNFYEMNP